jgi:hypothetical protein
MTMASESQSGRCCSSKPFRWEGSVLSAPRILTEARAGLVLATVRRLGPFGLSTLVEEEENELGLTLQQHDEAIDRLVDAGRAQLRVGHKGVWLELEAKALGQRGIR